MKHIIATISAAAILLTPAYIENKIAPELINLIQRIL
jgi:hypothetical protein